MFRRAPGLLLLLACLGLLAGSTGCAAYRLGTGAKLAFQSLYVEPVENQSLLPQARALLTTQIRDAVARDGRVVLAKSAAEADAILAVTVTTYRREVMTVREGDTGLARKFNVTLAATCTLTDRRNNQALFTGRPVESQREVFTDSGQLQSEYQTLPLLAEALAGKIAHATLDVW